MASRPAKKKATKAKKGSTASKMKKLAKKVAAEATKDGRVRSPKSGDHKGRGWRG